MVQKKGQPLNKPLGRRILPVLVALTVSGGAAVFLYSLAQLSSNSEPQAAPTALPNKPVIKGAAALGRLEPQGEVIRLSAPTSTGTNRVTQLLIKEGDKVTKGQIVAIMETNERSQAALNRAKAEVKVAKAQLERVKAGAKSGDIQARREDISRLRAELQGQIATQEATIARIEAEVENAKVENRRYQGLFRAGLLLNQKQILVACDSKPLKNNFKKPKKQKQDYRNPLKFRKSRQKQP